MEEHRGDGKPGKAGVKQLTRQMKSKLIMSTKATALTPGIAVFLLGYDDQVSANALKLRNVLLESLRGGQRGDRRTGKDDRLLLRAKVFRTGVHHHSVPERAFRLLETERYFLIDNPEGMK